MQANLWQAYQSSDPGKVQVLGVEMFNRPPSEVDVFRTNIGATFPLLLNGSSSTGLNMSINYGERDNYVVIGQNRRIRYNAQLKYAHGNRYHVTEIRAVVDSLLDEATVGVGDPTRAPSFRLEAFPNPSRGPVDLAWTNPTGAPSRARVTVHDLAGRRVASLWDGPSPAGETRITWNGLGARGIPLPAGVYLVRAQVGDAHLTRRIVRVR